VVVGADGPPLLLLLLRFLDDGSVVTPRTAARSSLTTVTHDRKDMP
jgi:hypothetical protein